MAPYLYPYLQHFSEIILSYWEESVGVANYISVHVCVHSPHILTDIFMFMCVISGEICCYKK